MSTSHRVGFMQGRLSPIDNGRIQSFPWGNWQEEFVIASSLQLNLMEWTLDQDGLMENPLLTSVGQNEINSLCIRYNITIPSLTGDCFMQAPLWKAKGADRAALEGDFYAIANACASIGIKMIVMPLVDNGRIENSYQEDSLVTFLQGHSQLLISLGLKVIFESDFEPNRLAHFIDRLDPDLFGINYDIGNSAALGFKSAEEFSAYGDRILNIHIKDRLLGGTTVPLGKGDADFQAVFSGLAKIGYQGNYILQTARDPDGDHAGALLRYYKIAIAMVSGYAA